MCSINKTASKQLCEAQAQWKDRFNVELCRTNDSVLSSNLVFVKAILAY